MTKPKRKPDPRLAQFAKALDRFASASFEWVAASSGPVAEWAGADRKYEQLRAALIARYRRALAGKDR